MAKTIQTRRSTHWGCKRIQKVHSTILWGQQIYPIHYRMDALRHLDSLKMVCHSNQKFKTFILEISWKCIHCCLLTEWEVNPWHQLSSCLKISTAAPQPPWISLLESSPRSRHLQPADNSWKDHLRLQRKSLLYMFKAASLGSVVIWWFDDSKSNTTNEYVLNCAQKGVVKGILNELPGFRLLGYAAQPVLGRLTPTSDNRFAIDLCDFYPESNPKMLR